MAGIYLHVPFCRQACYYCDFHFSTNLERKAQLITAMAQELVLQQGYLFDKDIQTIYFGGGTPSLLSDAEMASLLETVYSFYQISNDAEVTLEANPDDLDEDKLKFLKSLGFNRLSIGIQTFSDDVLKYLNRVHTSRDAVSSVEAARRTGFDNISVDLIYGIPLNGHDGWEADLSEAMKLKPEHISAYCLTIEDKTTFGNWLKKGRIKPIDDEYAASQFEFLISFLKQHNYEQYEISNFCLPGKHSRHNTNYWKQKEYLGIGPGAHSFNGISRQYNVSNNAKYLRSIENGIIPFELDTLSIIDRVNEMIMTSLRTKWGCNLDFVFKDFSLDLYKINETYINQLIRNDLVVLINQHLILTEKGKLLADKIASDLFVS